jgi:hypothetical protein
MISIIILAIATTVLFAVILLPGINTQVQAQDIQWKNHNNTILGLSVDYPSMFIVQEKQDRFEEDAPLIIQSYLEGPTGTTTFTSPDIVFFQADLDLMASTNQADKNITTLATSLLERTIDYQSVRESIIEGVNTTRYKIGGDDAGSFITVTRIDSNNLASEYVVIVHNNQVYTFKFMTPAIEFDTPRMSDVRKHMFDSIRWLN